MEIYTPRLPRSSPKARSHKKKEKVRGINRFRLDDLAGVLKRDGPGLVTIQILEEANFLSRDGANFKASEHAITSQKSLPVAFDSLRNVESTSFNLGLNVQKFSPLKLARVFGRPGNLPVFNLTGLHKSHILFAASNALVYYDYYNNSQSILQGHERKISCIETSSEHIASGELEPNSTLIVWNIKTGFPVKRISATDGQSLAPILAMGFVGTLNFIGLLHRTEKVKVVKGKPDGHKVMFRNSVSIWYFGPPEKRVHHHTETHSEVQIDIPRNAGSQTQIVFSQDIPYHFITSGDHQVVFHTWLPHERKIISHVPTGHLQFMKRLERFNTSIWFNDSVLTTTSSGYIAEWKAQPALGFEDILNPRHNIKEFRRYIKIDADEGLTAIVAHKGFIVVGDTFGGVRFLDNKFRLMRLTTTGTKQPIRSLAFNLTDQQPAWKAEMQSTYASTGYDHRTMHRVGESAVYDYTFGGEKGRVLSETTIDRQPLHRPSECLDMVVGYENGRIDYFHIAEEKVDTIMKETFGDENIVAMDASPMTPHFAMSTLHGALQLCDYRTHKVLFSQKIFKKEVEVTCLKFHPSGAFIVLGTSKGTVYFRRAYTLGLISNPVQTGKKSITKIAFSSCGLFMGLTDDGFTVTLCKYSAGMGVWTIKGRHQSHYRPIADIAFMHDTIVGYQRLFTIGQDKRLVEYDISESSPTAGLKILTVTVIEQKDIPTSMIFDAPFQDHGPMLLYANTNNKIRMFDQDACKIRKTCQGPKYGAPVVKMTQICMEAMAWRESKIILTVMGNKIGLMMTPIDGNPFKYMAVLGHPNEIRSVGIGPGGNEIFTHAKEDKCIFMWTPDLLVLESGILDGGTGIKPFKTYLDAGAPPHASIVEDIKFVFYHLLMKGSENQQELLNKRLTIPLTEIPTVMRTCGYFPSELEIDMIVEEAEFLLSLKFGLKTEEIGYEDFLILFANHRDTGVSAADVTRAFEILGEENESNEVTILRENFVSMITTKGETLREQDLPLFLPSFYKEVYQVVEVEKKKEEWCLRPSIYLSPTKSAISVASFGTNRSDHSVHSGFTGDRHSVFFSESESNFEPSARASRVSKLEKPKTPSIVESEVGEVEEYAEPTKEMPEEITANFFTECLLLEEVDESLHLSRNELLDEMQDLDQISADQQGRKVLDEIVERWECREEWRYFKQIFERLKAASVPFEQRLTAVLEMDNYFRTKNKQPYRTSGAKDEDIALTAEFDAEEEEGTIDSDDESVETTKTNTDSSSSGTELEKLEKAEQAGVENEMRPSDTESNMDYAEEQGNRDGGDSTETDGPALSVQDTVYEDDFSEGEAESDHEGGEMADEDETVDESDDVTQGNRDSPPFTGITDAEFEEAMMPPFSAASGNDAVDPDQVAESINLELQDTAEVTG